MVSVFYICEPALAILFRLYNNIIKELQMKGKGNYYETFQTSNVSYKTYFYDLPIHRFHCTGCFLSELPLVFQAADKTDN